jgi:hypothetical protein
VEPERGKPESKWIFDIYLVIKILHLLALTAEAIHDANVLLNHWHHELYSDRLDQCIG